MISGSGFRGSGVRVEDLIASVQDSGFRVYGSDFGRFMLQGYSRVRAALEVAQTSGGGVHLQQLNVLQKRQAPNLNPGPLDPRPRSLHATS